MFAGLERALVPIAWIGNRVAFPTGRHGHLQGKRLALAGVGEIGDIIIASVVLVSIFAQVAVYLLHGLDGLGAR